MLEALHLLLMSRFQSLSLLRVSSDLFSRGVHVLVQALYALVLFCYELLCLSCQVLQTSLQCMALARGRPQTLQEGTQAQQPVAPWHSSHDIKQAARCESALHRPTCTYQS